ncbi:MAG: hypothetical protein E6J14_08145 [Chloroflexi bacterium]|nr:MAG: hypothetical protein E6J14_08145 [Chloroflexota bacterium]
MTSERGAVDVRAASRVLPRLGSVASRDASAIVALTLAILATYVVAALAFHPTIAPGAARFVVPSRLDPLIHWDAGWYTRITRWGYTHVPNDPQQPTAYWPLFPGLTVGLQRLVPVLSIFLSGIVVNIVATCGAMLLVAALFPHWLLRHRLLLIAFLCTLPSAFFYVTYFSEAVFTFSVALTMWGLNRPGRAWWVVLGVVLATLDRPIGALLIIPVAVVLLRGDQAGRGFPHRALLAAVACSGVAMLAVLSLAVTGSADGMIRAHAAWNDFNNSGYLINALHAGRRATGEFFLRHLLWQGTGDPADRVYSLGAVEDILVLVGTLAAWVWRRSYAVIALLLFAGAVAIGGVDSQARYMVTVIPAWVALVVVIRRWAPWWAVLTAVAVAGWVVNLVLLHRYLAWEWAG